MKTKESTDGIAVQFGHWIALYAAYLFLAGWTYRRFYYDVFGATWIETGVEETVVKGFTVLFNGTWGWALGMLYAAVLFASIWIELMARAPSRFAKMSVLILLVVAFVPTYVTARHVGIDDANKDRSNETRLPTVTFMSGSCKYRGKLVALSGELLYASDLVTDGFVADRLGESGSSARVAEPCKSASVAVPELAVIRISDVTHLRVIHYERRAKS